VTRPRHRPSAHSIAPAAGALFALMAIAAFGGCFVSFDGYQLGESGAANRLSDAGQNAKAGTNDGDAGSPDGGSSTNAAGSAGESARAGRSGVAGAGSGGTSNSKGGTAGTLETAGAGRSSAGSSGKSSAGSAGTSGAGSSGAGSGGSSGAGSSGAGSSGAGSSGAGSGGTSGAQYGCLTTHARISVEIPRAGSPSIYCIDRSEVKNAEYKAFLDAVGGATAGAQAPACAFNSSYAPDTAGACNQYDPVGKANLPVACVDWCDAAAYCKWEGKHLCGRVDGGGANPPASSADATMSAWYRACSHAGELDLPYGNVYDGMRCIGLDNAAIHPVAVPHTDCEGGYSGLYDMSGNVAEWEDSCSGDTGATDSCLTRGGSYLDTDKPVGNAPSLLCNSKVHGNPGVATKPRSTRNEEIGFRCCSDAVLIP